MPQKVLVIVGPTASGKSALGVRLAKKFRGEVISADSRQVYRGLDIGTGKITKQEMRGIQHHLLDVASPKKAFSAGDFVTHGRRAIDDIAHRASLPIIVGGTGFYIDALVGRISLPEVPPDKTLRKKLQTKSAAQLFALLQRRDPKRAKLMETPSERNNKVRLIRALEIAGSPQYATDAAPTYDTLWIGIELPLATLEKKIAVRLHKRLKGGMIQEAQRLRRAGLSLKRMRELGLEYRSLADLLEKKVSKRELEKTLRSEIRRYAKKQLGYWRRNGNIRWFKPTEYRKIERAVGTWLNRKRRSRAKL